MGQKRNIWILKDGAYTMMKKSKIMLAAALGLATLSAPAQADVFTYNMSNGSTLKIDNVTKTASFVGSDINATMASAAFANFVGGATPTFSAVLSALDGTRLVNGKWVTDNPYLSTSSHPQKLIMSGSNVNLWAWWGSPITAGDYITRITGYSVSTSGGNPVPEPGMLGLFGAALAGLGFARRRKAKAKLAVA